MNEITFECIRCKIQSTLKVDPTICSWDVGERFPLIPRHKCGGRVAKVLKIEVDQK